jgi:DNA-binding PadR family transcriptional regulator
MRSRNRDHGFGAWAAFCGPQMRFGGRRFRARFFDRGDLRYFILKLLADRPMHGYEVMQALSKEVGGWYQPSAGSVYPVLQLLEDQEFVTSEDRDGKKVYSITAAGRKFLEDNSERVEDVFDRVSGVADRYTGSEMRDLTRSFIRFAQVSFEEALRSAGDTTEVDRLKDILERATREMEDAARGAAKGPDPAEA